MSNNFHELIHDENQIRKFVEIMAPLQNDEVYFVSMSARNKYLTEDERRLYDLGRTEMFARELVKPSNRVEGGIVETYLRVLKSMQVSYGGYTSRSGVPLPSKCLVVYANINASSGIKAVEAFQKEMMNSLFDMRTNFDSLAWFAHADTKLMNCFQKFKGSTKLLDVDFDIPKDKGFSILVDFINFLESERALVMEKKDISIPLEYWIVETKSGYHVLLNKDTLGFNYNIGINKANAEATVRFGKSHIEVALNKNGMIPLPGTIQAGHPVRFIEI